MGEAKTPRLDTVLLAAFAVLLPLALHARLFTGEAVFHAPDAAELELPRYLILARALDEGSLATWQTLLHGGSPFHANLESPSSYPPVLLLVAGLGSVLGMNASTVLHLAFGALGTFLLVRRLIARLAGEWVGLASAGAAVAAVCAALDPHLLDAAGVPAVEGAANAWAPWVLLAADALVRSSSRSAAPGRARRAAGGLALALWMQLSTGVLHVAAYTWLALLAWLVLGAGPARYPRMLAWGALAALSFAGLAAAKLVPFVELLAATNRPGAIAYDAARGVTLGGPGELRPIEAVRGVLALTGGGATIVLAFLSLPLARRSAALRAALVIALAGASVALGGTTHRYLAVLPPFDRIPGAIHAWTLVGVALPIAAGFGSAWLLARARRLLTGRAASAAAAGVLALVLGFSLHRAAPEVRAHELHLDELPALYPHWAQLAELAGDRRRGFHLEGHVPDLPGEQLVASLLGVETPAGRLGRLRPRRLERHLYLEGGAEMPFERRARRLAVLSVGFVVAGPSEGPDGRGGRASVEGQGVASVPGVRPRAILPSAAVGLIGDREDDGWLYALLDAPSFPVERASLIVFEDGTITADEARALDAAIVVGGADATELARFEQLGRLARVGGAPDHEVAERALERALPAPVPAEGLGFERISTRASAVSLADVPARAGARFAVVSEPWSLYPGWRVESEGRRIPVRRADGVASAVLVPPDALRVEAHYRPRSVAVGIALGGLALALALFLLVAPLPAAD